MDRGELEDEQETLKSIAAMLLGLAALAELLCVLPLSLRVFLLPLLRHAAAVTRAFATERAGGALALPVASAHAADDDGRAEALHLARCLRALASIIGFLSTLPDFAGRPRFRGAPDRRLRRAPAAAWRGHFMNARRTIAFPAASRIDTS